MAGIGDYGGIIVLLDVYIGCINLEGRWGVDYRRFCSLSWEVIRLGLY